MPFEILAGLFMFQHVVFVIFRPIFMLFWTCLTCCCDCGQNEDFNENDTFDWSKISPEYIANINANGAIAPVVGIL